jgi:hypothetical protein
MAAVLTKHPQGEGPSVRSSGEPPRHHPHGNQRLLGYKTRYKTVLVVINSSKSMAYTHMCADAGSADRPPPVTLRSKTVPDWRCRKPPDCRIGGVCSARIIALPGGRNTRCRAAVGAARTAAAGLRAERRAALALRLPRCRLSRAARATRAADSYVSTLISSSLKKKGLSANLCSSRLNLRSRVP